MFFLSGFVLNVFMLITIVNAENTWINLTALSLCWQISCTSSCCKKRFLLSWHSCWQIIHCCTMTVVSTEAPVAVVSFTSPPLRSVTLKKGVKCCLGVGFVLKFLQFLFVVSELCERSDKLSLSPCSCKWEALLTPGLWFSSEPDRSFSESPIRLTGG